MKTQTHKNSPNLLGAETPLHILIHTVEEPGISKLLLRPLNGLLTKLGLKLWSRRLRYLRIHTHTYIYTRTRYTIRISNCRTTRTLSSFLFKICCCRFKKVSNFFCLSFNSSSVSSLLFCGSDSAIHTYIHTHTKECSSDTSYSTYSTVQST